MSERTELERLQSAVQDMDCLSQGAFSKISALAKLSLAYMETPDGYLHPESIAHALHTIRGIADDIKNCINCSAEEVGFNYRDEDRMRRDAAQRAANDELGRRKHFQLSSAVIESVPNGLIDSAVLGDRHE